MQVVSDGAQVTLVPRSPLSDNRPAQLTIDGPADSTGAAFDGRPCGAFVAIISHRRASPVFAAARAR